MAARERAERARRGGEHAPPSSAGASGAVSPAAAALGNSGEDYLVGIAALADDAEPTTGARLAKLLGVSEPSVTQMLRRLTALGLVTRSADGDMAGRRGIWLTPDGAAAATWLLTRRRVCECFFVDGIGLDWPTARQAADQMEHGLAFEAVQQLHQGLGAPTTCPHGNPINLDNCQPTVANYTAVACAGNPNADGEPTPVPALADVPKGTRVVVGRLHGPVEQDVEALRYLQEQGITPGQCLDVVERVPGAAALTVRLGRRLRVLPLWATAFVGVRVPQATVATAAGAAASADSAGECVPPPCQPAGSVRLTAVRVEGPCESGHAVGDGFMLGHRTPDGLCGATYAAMLPVVKRLLAAPEGAAPTKPFERRCPGNGYVVWRFERVPASPPPPPPAPGRSGGKWKRAAGRPATDH